MIASRHSSASASGVPGCWASVLRALLQLKQRIAALAVAGYAKIAIQIVPGQEHAIEDWGRIRRTFA